MSILSRYSRKIVWIGIAAFAFRLCMIAWCHSGYYVTPQDTLSSVYYQQGSELSRGLGYVRHLPNGSTIPEMLHPPGMSALIALSIFLFKIHSFLALQLLGSLLDSIVALLLAWIVSVSISEELGLLSGWFYAFSPVCAFASASSYSPEGIQALSVLVTAIAILFSCQAVKWKTTLILSGLAGIATGVGALLRPDYLFQPIFLSLCAVLMARKVARPAVTLVVSMGLAFLILTPWAVRNHALCGRWIFTSTSPGATLVDGLAEFNNPWGLGGSDADRDRDAQQWGLTSPWSPEADLRFQHVFWHDVQQHPEAFLVSICKRTPLAIAAPQSFGFNNPMKSMTFSQWRAAGLDRYQVLRHHPWYVLGAYWDNVAMAIISFVSMFAAVFLIFRVGTRWPLVLFLVASHIYSILVHMLTHIEPRYLLPSYWCLMLGFASLFARRSLRTTHHSEKHPLDENPDLFSKSQE